MTTEGASQDGHWTACLAVAPKLERFGGLGGTFDSMSEIRLSACNQDMALNISFSAPPLVRLDGDGVAVAAEAAMLMEVRQPDGSYRGVAAIGLTAACQGAAYVKVGLPGGPLKHYTPMLRCTFLPGISPFMFIYVIFVRRSHIKLFFSAILTANIGNFPKRDCYPLLDLELKIPVWVVVSFGAKTNVRTSYVGIFKASIAICLWD